MGKNTALKRQRARRKAEHQRNKAIEQARVTDNPYKTLGSLDKYMKPELAQQLEDIHATGALTSTNLVSLSDLIADRLPEPYFSLYRSLQQDILTHDAVLNQGLLDDPRDVMETAQGRIVIHHKMLEILRDHGDFGDYHIFKEHVTTMCAIYDTVPSIMIAHELYF